MKRLVTVLLFGFFSIIIAAQDASTGAEQRLNSIINLVKVTGDEKARLVKAIEKFQDKELEITTPNSA